MEKAYKRLGDLLVAQRVLTPEQLTQALQMQTGTRMRLGEVLIENKFVSEETIAACLAEQYGYDVVDPAKVQPTEFALRALSWEIAREQRLLPVTMDTAEIYCLVADPLNLTITDELALRFRRKISLAIAPEKKLLERIQAVYSASSNRSRPGVPPRFINPLARTESDSVSWIDAYDSNLDRPVSLICVPIDSNARDQQLRQVKSCGRANHPVLATVYDSITHEQCRWTILHPLPGLQLVDTLRLHRERSPSEAATIVASVAKAAHELKLEGFPWICPENIWISSAGTQVAPVFPVNQLYRSFGEIEALGNLLWHCLVGNPGAALDFSDERLEAVPSEMILILQKCLSKGDDRFRSPVEVESALSMFRWTGTPPASSEASLDREELMATLKVVTTQPREGFWKKVFRRPAA